MAYPFDLQLFGEGGAAGAGGASGATGAAGAPAAGVAASPQADTVPENPRSKRNPLANVVYGRQTTQESGGQSTPAGNQQNQQGTQPQDDAAEWNELRNGRFKAQFDADVQSIVGQRLKNAKAAQASMDKLSPMLEAMAKKYGTEAGDIDALVSKYLDEDTLYEDEAAEQGMSVQALKQLKAMQRERDTLRQQAEVSMQERQNRQHIEGLVRQADAFRQKMPSFDMRKEMSDPNFVRLTSPGVGLSVEDAYYVLHREELQQNAMRAAAQQTKQEIANTMRANRARPSENGVRASSAVEDVRSDPRKLSRADHREIKRRVMNGEKIAF